MVLDYGSRVRVGMAENARLLGKGTILGSWVRWGRMLSSTLRWNGEECMLPLTKENAYFLDGPGDDACF